MTTARSLRAEAAKLKNRQKALRRPHVLTTSEARYALENLLTGIEARVANARAEGREPEAFPVPPDDPLRLFLDRWLTRLDAEEGRLPQ